MRYQLIKPINPNYSTLEQVLTNRGIEYKDIFHYLNTTDEDINSPLLFGEKKLLLAVTKLSKVIQNNGKVLVIVDSDCDGFTSSAVLINYLHDLFPVWVENRLSWFIHEGKQHGLSDLDNINNLNAELVIVPDAGSNDYKYHKILKDQGIDVIILDHHEAENISKNAIIINNQLSDYPNKELSGVGVTWQFCKYIDNLLEYNYADKYLDLVSLGLCADMMSLKSIETKHLMNKGFQQVTNPFFLAMSEKNSYSMKDKINSMSVAFYIAPYVNAIVRSGTLKEKEIVFQSMLTFKAFEKIPSTKRGHKLGEQEQLYVQAIRTATNVKNRQTRAQEAGLETLEKMIEQQNLLDHKVLLFLLDPGQIDKNIAGLIANKFMAKYQRPCCILTRGEEIITTSVWDENAEYWNSNADIYGGAWEKGKFIDKKISIISYQGSARGYDKSGITNFKDICSEFPDVLYAEGHQGAFGLSLPEYAIKNFIEYTDEVLKDMSSEPIYYVDYIYEGYNIDSQNILDIATYEELWGKDIDEPLIAIHNLRVTKNMVTLMSPDKSPTLKITLPNKISLIKFNSSQEEYESFLSDGYITFDIIGRCNKNEWCGNVTPQIFIEDFEKISSNKYFF